MPAPFRKKLIEVSIPLDAINKESLRRKQKAPKGYPTSIHKYWAQRPIALCRAVLFAQLVDDPSSVPEEFPTSTEMQAERNRLHKLMERLILWENSLNEAVLTEARYEIARSIARERSETLPPLNQMRPQQVLDYLQEHAPPVYDPFSGGGSIPLEAQRLGLRAMGSDLNPVAVLISKALVEYPPKFAGRQPVNPDVNALHTWKGAKGLAEDVRYYGRWMRAEAEKKIGHLYPKVTLADGKTEATVTAWLWVRTVPSPDPRVAGANVPLASSFVLSTKEGKQVVVKPAVDRAKMAWHFEIDDKPSADALKAAKNGTKSARGANFTCVLTGTAISDTHVKAEAMAGRMSASLMAVVAEGNRKRVYLAPTPEQEKVAQVTAPDVPEVDQPMPKNPRWFSPPDYGMPNFIDLFTPRQLTALTTFSDLVMVAREKVLGDAKFSWSGQHADDTHPLAEGGLGPVAYADAVATYLAIAVDRMIFHGSSLCGWLAKDNAMGKTMPKQALAMSWDFAEGNPLGTSSSDILTCLKSVAACLDESYTGVDGVIQYASAQTLVYEQNALLSTDPPYYDNVGYADLSDFFYSWLRRSLQGVHPELFRTLATPKRDELVATPYRHGGKSQAEQFFMNGMQSTLERFTTSLDHNPATIYYAYKQQEVGADALTSPGWASFLQAVSDSGLLIDATWPVRSESEGRAIAQGTNALASSIVLVCRRRDALATAITRADFLRSLRKEMPPALAEIKRAGVGPTDIQQAAIGPGMGIFTRHAQVLNTDGTPMMVKDALKLINQVREEITGEGDTDYDSETRFALDWFAAKGFEKGKSGEAINMCNAVDVSLDQMRRAGFFFADGGVARLLKREELPGVYDPAKDTSPTVWEACQHLIKRLTSEDGGVDDAALLYAALGARAEPAHALARRLYDICEQKQWHAEGRVYNQLHQEWEAIEKRAAGLARVGVKPDLFNT